MFFQNDSLCLKIKEKVSFNAKIGNLFEILNSVNKTKMTNSDETFWVIFKQCVTLNLKTYTCG